MGFDFFFFLLHLYSIDICNGWKINVSDVPVNVNKIKPVLKATQHVPRCDNSSCILSEASVGEHQGLRVDFSRSCGCGRRFVSTT